LVAQAIFSLRMVGKARFFEKAWICGAALVANDYLIEHLKMVVAPAKRLNHLGERLLKALKDPANLLKIVVLTVIEFELGLPCIVAKGQFDNAWDWGPNWDRVVAALKHMEEGTLKAPRWQHALCIWRHRGAGKRTVDWRGAKPVPNRM
jgi:hypothetical protein